VRSFGGFQVKDLKVEAACEDSENQVVEATTTDKNGSYRIKGLIPGKTYAIRVTNSSNSIVIPESVSLPIKNKDTRNVDSCNSR
jgi:hypothetical protein